MCHPWLAAGVTCLLALLAVRELATLPPATPPADGLGDANAFGLLGRRLRLWFRARMAPLVELAVAAGISADAITRSQLVTSLVAAGAYARGWMFVAGWLLIASGTLDVLDGQVARRRGAAGPRGAFVDSLVDRYSESAVYAGLAVFYRTTWALWAVLAAWVGALLVSYARARAEALGVDCRVGWLQRPERYVVLGVGSMASTLLAHLTGRVPSCHGVAAASIALLAVLAHVTVWQRARATLRALP